MMIFVDNFRDISNERTNLGEAFQVKFDDVWRCLINFRDILNEGTNLGEAFQVKFYDVWRYLFNFRDRWKKKFKFV